MSGFHPPRRLRVEHRTRFDYERTVAASYNECRIQPRTAPRQQILESKVTIEPSTWRYDYQDYWGTGVIAFEVRTPHTALTVTGSTVADIMDGGAPPQADWHRIRSPATVDAFAETLVTTPRTQPVAEVLAVDVPVRP